MTGTRAGIAGLLLTVAFGTAGCGAPARTLLIRSDPADAEVCVKGRADSGFFKSEKVCVGSTPFDADRVLVPDGHLGAKREVKFKDVERAHESFFVIVSRPGYAPQALEVPSWEHVVVLKPERVR